MMVDNLIKILNKNSQIDGYKIVYSKTKSNELFFIKKDLDMKRFRNVDEIGLTIYKDFTEDNTLYKGSAYTKIHPTMSKKEMKEAIKSATYSASYVKNKHFTLAEKTLIPNAENQSMFEKNYTQENLTKVINAIFKADVYDAGFINSTEVFLKEIDATIINSNGVRLTEKKHALQIEFITTWKGEEEEIELYKIVNFAKFDESKLTSEIEKMFELCKGRAIAKDMPKADVNRLILSDESVHELVNYYVQKSNVFSVYNKYSDYIIGQNIQGDNVKGDRLNITLDPFLEGSTKSSMFDADGIVLEEVNIIEDGVLRNFWGNNQFSQYLKVEPTGTIQNIKVKEGSVLIEEMKNESYLEVVSFSDLQVNTLTGDFGGEVRFARYYDGEKIIPVTNVSISGDLSDNHDVFYLSKETHQINNYFGPVSILLKNFTISGN